MIKADRLSLSYKGRAVLSDVSLTLDRGELCTVIGANGSGKTSLIRLLGRVVPQSSGSFSVDSVNASEFSHKEYAQKVSRLAQSRDIPCVTVSDFVAGGRYPYLGFSGRLSDADRAAVNKAMELTDTHRLETRDLRELSGGERQRVYFAMILAQDTPYVLLDEPATFLDASAQLELYRLIKSLKDMGKGILTVSHDLSFALKNSDKILLLDNGRARFFGSPDEEGLIPAIERAFSVRCIEYTVDGEKEYFFKEADRVNGRQDSE